METLKGHDCMYLKTCQGLTTEYCIFHVSNFGNKTSPMQYSDFIVSKIFACKNITIGGFEEGK